MIVWMAAVSLVGQLGGTPPPIPSVAFGKVERIEALASKLLPSRLIDVWLPEGYTPKKRYRVLYMHDGQMLFDANTTWNHQEWQVDETLGRLMRIGAIHDTIVVGLWNRGEYRHAEYYPQRPLEDLSAATRKRVIDGSLRGKPLSDAYLSYLVKEVKPYIDKRYSTYPDRNHTFVAGSSMGGLISMYALCEYPEVFGGAICISTHWPGTRPSPDPAVPKAFIDYLDKHLPSPSGHKLYFDRGDRTLDAEYQPWQDLVNQVVARHHWGPKSFQSLAFPGDDHSEASWNRRFYLPVVFMLAKTR